MSVVGITTTAVFNVDDDVRMPCDALSRGFRAWRANRDVLVGYYPRTHKPSPDGCGWRYVWNDLEMWWHGDFSIVLTKAAFMKTSYLALYSRGLPQEAREYIDARKNCEDIAMQLLVSAETRKPPVYVPVPLGYYLWAKWEGFGVAGISKSSTHHDVRGGCITDLSRIIIASQSQSGGVEEGGDGGGNGGGEGGGGGGMKGKKRGVRAGQLTTPLVRMKLKVWEGR